MAEALTHPTPQELAAFGLGKLPDSAAAEIATHLEVCTACRQVVASLPADSFLGKVRAAGPGGPSPFPARPAPGDRTILPVQAAAAFPCPGIPPELAQHSKFQVLRELGRGGMGVVYQARQTIMNRPIVIKVVNPALLDQPDALHRFHQEVRAAAQLSHANIVTAYDAEQVGSLHLLVMEFVPGQSLAEVLEKQGPLPVAQACDSMRQAALGLQHAHERGMVHRDVKPHNLIRTPQGQVKILDFGLAKLASERRAGKGLTGSNAYMGTPEYSAPEQAIDARKADIRADLYSLGCTLYCLLAGGPPFREDTPVKTILAHLEKEPQPLTEIRQDVPAALWKVVARLLAKDPAQRFQTPAEVARALAPFARPGPRTAEPPVAPAPVASLSERATMPPSDTSPGHRAPRPAKSKAVAMGNSEPPVRRRAGTPAPAPSSSAGVELPAERPRPPWWRRPGVVAGTAGGSVTLALMAVIIINVRVKVPPADTGKATLPHGEAAKQEKAVRWAAIQLQIDQPGSEVFVDGEKITVTNPGDPKSIQIKVDPGQHKLRITKGGFEVVTREVELKEGTSRFVRISLVPTPKVVDVRPVEKPPEPAPAPPRPAPPEPTPKPPLTTPEPGSGTKPPSPPTMPDVPPKPPSEPTKVGQGPSNKQTPRQKRMLRWVMSFNTNNGPEYLAAMRGLGAILAIQVKDDPPEFKVVRKLSPPTRLLNEDVEKIDRIIWWEENPAAVRDIMNALGLNIRPSRFAMMLPAELEKKLFELESKHAKGRAEDDIAETKFRCVRVGNHYEAVFHSIKLK